MTPAEYAAALDARIAEAQRGQVPFVYERARGGDRSRAPTTERLREELGRLSWIREQTALRGSRFVTK